VLLGSVSRGQRTAEITKLLDAAFTRDLAGKLPLAALRMAAADEGAPPTVLTGAACSAQGDGESLVAQTARVGQWGIIFGSFFDKAKAQIALSEARKKLGVLGKAGKSAIAPKSYNGIKQWSAMIVGLSQQSAGNACKALWAKNAYCLALRPEVLSNRSMAWR
jgi:hypothetical protein